MNEAAQWNMQSTLNCWACVRRWPGIDPQAKIAWFYLWERSIFQPGSVSIHISEIGIDQGTAWSDRAGRKAMKALIRAGLAKEIKRKGGQWNIQLFNPLEVKRALEAKASEPGEPPATPPRDVDK